MQRISHDLQDWVDLPAPDVPDLGGSDFRRLQARAIEAAAFDMRAHWNLGRGPIADLSLVLENAGIVTGRCAFDAPSTDGVSHWSRADDRPYVPISSEKRTAVRSRFDAAHELGHLVLHRRVDRSALTRRDEFKELEGQAHRFAGAFLLPRAEVLPIGKRAETGEREMGTFSSGSNPDAGPCNDSVPH